MIEIKPATLVNAREIAKANSKTFTVPTQESLDLLRGGDLVKVCTGGERFWVMIANKEVTDTGIVYIGCIDNQLVCTADHGLRCGNLIQLRQENIYDIIFPVQKEPRLKNNTDIN